MVQKAAVSVSDCPACCFCPDNAPQTSASRTGNRGYGPAFQYPPDFWGPVLVAKNRCESATRPPDQTVLVEDPRHAALRAAITANGLRYRPTGVDADGLTFGATSQQAFQAIAVTPSRQFPLGMTREG